MDECVLALLLCCSISPSGESMFKDTGYVHRIVASLKSLANSCNKPVRDPHLHATACAVIFFSFLQGVY